MATNSKEHRLGVKTGGAVTKEKNAREEVEQSTSGDEVLVGGEEYTAFYNESTGRVSFKSGAGTSVMVSRGPMLSAVGTVAPEQAPLPPHLNNHQGTYIIENEADKAIVDRMIKFAVMEGHLKEGQHIIIKQDYKFNETSQLIQEGPYTFTKSVYHKDCIGLDSEVFVHSVEEGLKIKINGRGTDMFPQSVRHFIRMMREYKMGDDRNSLSGSLPSNTVSRIPMLSAVGTPAPEQSPLPASCKDHQGTYTLKNADDKTIVDRLIKYAIKEGHMTQGQHIIIKQDYKFNQTSQVQQDAPYTFTKRVYHKECFSLDHDIYIHTAEGGMKTQVDGRGIEKLPQAVRHFVRLMRELEKDETTRYERKSL